MDWPGLDVFHLAVISATRATSFMIEQRQPAAPQVGPSSQTPC